MSELDRQFKGDMPEPGSERERLFSEQRDKLHEIISTVITRRKEERGPSSQQVYNPIDAALALNIPIETMTADLITIFIGGFHTSASLLIFAIYALAMHPDIQERARAEVKQVCRDVEHIDDDDVANMTYLMQVINETLRWAVVGSFSARTHDQDMTLGGHFIPAGTPVIHALGAALHDPDIFPEPEKFDPDRFSPEKMEKFPPYAFEPFGFAGKRKCLGNRFSLAEASVMVAKLLQSGPRFELAPGQKVAIKYDITAKPVDEIWIRVVDSSA